MVVHLLAERGQDFLGGAHTEVGAEQCGFELFQQFGIDRAITGEQLLDTRGKLRASFADGIFQALQERRFGWSEQ